MRSVPVYWVAIALALLGMVIDYAADGALWDPDSPLAPLTAAIAFASLGLMGYALWLARKESRDA